jgi:hypothetical protein
MDFTVVSHQLDLVKTPGRIGTVEEIQQVQKQPRHLPKPKARMYSTRAQIQSPGPIATFVLTECHHFHWGGLRHPLRADFGQQVKVEFVRKQQGFALA